MTGVVAYICAIMIILLAALGPLGLGDIQYRSSESGIWQLEGQDLTDLALIAPLLLIGGTMQLMRRPSAKYFLILTPVTLIYAGIVEGIGQEWSSTAHDGNVEHYFWIFLIIIIGGLVLLIGTLSMFTKQDAPDFNPKWLRIFVIAVGLALLMFALMWTAQVVEVLDKGDLSDGSYTAAPTAFWVVKYLDLGFTIPVGFISLFLLMARPKQAYHLVLLFYGFFVTTGTAST